jgi:formylglycine-generating enzyme required for sulfatase activity
MKVRFHQFIAVAGLALTCAPAAPGRPAESVKPAGGLCGGAAALSLASRRAAPLSAAEECRLKPKDSFRECENCPEMVVVPAGSFTMGSPVGEKDRSGSEGPQHVVTISKPLAIGRLHVTRDQFAMFANETGYAAHSECSWSNPGFAQDGSHPVVCVNWDDATAYVDWLARKTGKPYRLLSEAEWEYAARARTEPGSYPRFWFGNDEKDLCRYGNGWDQTAGNNGAPCDDGYHYTSPAGHYEPNAFGLYDMFGNAWQWTADCWHRSYKGAPADGSAWVTGCEENVRVVRGGSWDIFPGDLRAAARNWDTAVDNGGGFRLARTLAP